MLKERDARGEEIRKVRTTVVTAVNAEGPWHKRRGFILPNGRLTVIRTQNHRLENYLKQEIKSHF